jgi:hypothetical protein
MCIVVQCGSSSIVEYEATIYVVDCVKCSASVNKCVRLSCTLGGSAYPQKDPDTHHIKYHFCSMRLNFVVSQYLLLYSMALYESFTLGYSHHSLWLMLLFYDTNRTFSVI